MKTGIVWLRRDLRLSDNHALYRAVRTCERIAIAFVVNPPLLDDGRIGSPIATSFFSAVGSLRADLRKRGSDLAVLRGDFAEELAAFCARTRASDVFFNEDFEPGAIARDAAVRSALEASGIAVHATLDHVYFGAGEVLNRTGEPYRVFSPYQRHWLEQRAVAPRLPFPSDGTWLDRRLVSATELGATSPSPVPEMFGLQTIPVWNAMSENAARARLLRFLKTAAGDYEQARNVPGLQATSRLSADLRAGTIGIRTCVESAFRSARGATPAHRRSIERWISELIWRDFYQSILRAYPHVERDAFQPAAANIAWRDAPDDFRAWCEGRTGYPMVDAGMRQLNATGWMHNRARMIVASFLTKHLLIDWRHGERYFAQRLADADLAQNNGGWQWAASTGTDAVSYFRVFNPTVQGKQFDPLGRYVKQFVPELNAVPEAYVHEPWLMPALCPGYPPPIVEHRHARERAIRVYREAFAHHERGQ
ncbi:MAG TPA: deoxyribodipyrimidine photo-lyase [Candidatus Baltobacteraceae bacterium]|nr:deoxyribodipyrimidine photo-lyase [Candidatus Baltobacteraceae bacterium]